MISYNMSQCNPLGNPLWGAGSCWAGCWGLRGSEGTASMPGAGVFPAKQGCVPLTAPSTSQPGSPLPSRAKGRGATQLPPPSVLLRYLKYCLRFIEERDN